MGFQHTRIATEAEARRLRRRARARRRRAGFARVAAFAAEVRRFYGEG